LSDFRILVLGATSAIAQAYARRRADEGVGFVLAGRHESRLAVLRSDLIARGASSAECFVIDLALIEGIEAAAKTLRAEFGEPDEIVIAYGLLGDQSASEHDISAARVLFDTNFTSAALWTLALLKDRAPSRRLTVVGIGSGAGDRGRARNFIYGAAKAGLNCFLEGLQQKYDGTMVHLVRVKPGLVDSPMTAALEKGSVLWSTPDRVAADIHRAVLRRRRVVYSPWFWRWIIMSVRLMPWCVFRRLKI
jgi:decaprenylphospho-beta-D-erythro-pentofuranosid-2-ulose 2-reductase